jgi:hypothetical protein
MATNPNSGTCIDLSDSDDVMMGNDCVEVDSDSDSDVEVLEDSTVDYVAPFSLHLLVQCYRRMVPLVLIKVLVHVMVAIEAA